MNIILYILILQVLGAIVCLLVPSKLGLLKKSIVLAVSLLVLIFNVAALSVPDMVFSFNLFGLSVGFGLGQFSSFAMLFLSAAIFLIIVYLFGYAGKVNNGFWPLLLIAAWLVNLIFLSDNLIALLIFCNCLTWVTHGLLAESIGGSAGGMSRRSLITAGIGDGLFLCGAIMVFLMTGTLDMSVINSTTFTNVNFTLSMFAFVLMCLAACFRICSVPFYSWVYEKGVQAPFPLIALFPSMIDKLLGVYILSRVMFNIFDISPEMGMILMAAGAITIIAINILSLTQKSPRQVFAHSHINEFGYILMGMASMNPAGIAGAIFHSLNDSLSKCSLALSLDSVEQQAGNSNGKTGFLAYKMPITFFSFITAVLVVSGIPFLAGFYSKWMIYQGVILNYYNKTPLFLTVFFLIAAVFGSAFSFASLLGLLRSLFLNNKKGSGEAQESKALMRVPLLLFSFFCIFFSIFIWVPVKYFIVPFLSKTAYSGSIDSLAFDPYSMSGPTLPTFLIIAGIIAGYIIYLLRALTSEN